MAKNFDDYVGRLTQEESAELFAVLLREMTIEKVVIEILKLSNRMDLEEIYTAIESHLTEKNFERNTPLENELEP